MAASFTYHGFRYVEVTGYSGSLTAADIEMLHFHSANPIKTNASYSSPVITAIAKMAVGAQRSNMMTVPTDCDQRDERLGWMGDANLSGDSMAINFDVLAFFSSFLATMDSELGPDGSSVDTAPYVRAGRRPGDIAWTTAYPHIGYALLKYTGATGPAKQYFDGFVKHLATIESRCQGYANATCPQRYGDWRPPPVKPGAGQGVKPNQG